jgi:hypothetical protein
MGVRKVPAYGCGGAVSSGVSAAGVASSAGVLGSGGSDGGGGGGGLEGGGVAAGVYGVVACWVVYRWSMVGLAALLLVSRLCAGDVSLLVG